MNSHKNKALVESFFEASNRGDLEHCFALLADDVTWTNIGSTRLSGTFAGKERIQEDLVGPLFGQLKAGIHSTLDNLVAEDDWVVAQHRGHAETLDGQPYNNTYCWVIRLRDGQIVEVTEYMDTALVNTALG